MQRPLDQFSRCRFSPATFGRDLEDFGKCSGEFLVSRSAIDDTFGEHLFTPMSDVANEIVVGATFVDMFIELDENAAHFDMANLHKYTEADLPEPDRLS